ncbi:MAG: hypothetical protein ACLR0P_13590 [Oscillospiraceae bacterium]
MENVLDEDDQLYRVVTGMYSAQMLDTVKDRPSAAVHRAQGRAWVPMHGLLPQRILRDRNGNEIKEWYALAAYLQSFGDEGVPNDMPLSERGRAQVR